MLQHFYRAQLAYHQILLWIVDGVLVCEERSKMEDIVRFLVEYSL